jgi:epoxyqueuosine reductase
VDKVSNTAAETRSRLDEAARGLGFDAWGVAAPAAALGEAGNIAEWLAREYHAGLGYLAREPLKRLDARSLLPSCQSVIVIAQSYYTAEPLPPGPGRIARYALGGDYHEVLREKLERLAAALAIGHPGLEYRISVDSSPVHEKAFALAAGIGWRGKHSLVLNARLGSFFCLGLLLVNLALVPDAPLAEQCGECRCCIDACPSGALLQGGVLNAGRCLSYQTTARKAGAEEGAALNGWLFGCDACQEACPHNAAPLGCSEPGLLPLRAMLELDAAAAASIDAEDFDARYRATVVGHYGLERLRRSAAMVLAQSDLRV